MKVLFIVGKGRSGSTLLENLLGQLDGWFSAGETIYVLDWGLLRNYTCGCGKPMHSCEIWTSIFDDAFGADWRNGTVRLPSTAAVKRWTDAPQVRVDDLWKLQQRVVRWHWALRIAAARPGRLRWVELGAYASVVDTLYRSIGSVTNAKVIVDSSKNPAYPPLWGQARSVEPYAVQLVRDPRAVTFSWQRHKEWPGDEEPAEMPRFGATYSSASWMARNLLSEVVRRRLGPSRSKLLRYEDLIAAPRAHVEAITELLDEPTDGLPVSADGTTTLEPGHTAGGNPSRFATGSIKVQLDDEWTRSASRSATRLTTALTSPLLRRYGYNLRI